MFELTAESAESAHRPLRERSLRSRVMAILAHVAGLLALLAVPVSRAINVQPETPTIQAFVATPEVLPALPTAPPPPSAPRSPSKSASVNEPPAAPSEAPIDIQPEPTSPPSIELDPGAEGGIEGGTPGGVIGGIAGGIAGTVAPVPPPPARSPARSAPLRTSGAIKPPDVIHRVDPVYPAIAVVSHIRGEVIVEAVVDAGGSVESVKVLRSSNPLLDKSATDAMKQWRYAPLVIADLPTPFVVMVTFNFKFPGVPGAIGNYD